MDTRELVGMPEQGKTQKVPYTGTAAASTALTEDRIVRVIATTAAHIRIGISAVAAADVDLYLPAGIPEYFNVPKGYAISAVQVSTGGDMFVTPM